MKSFPAIRIEGGLFAPDLLDQLLAEELPGQKLRDFGLDGRRGLTDEIAAIFADAQKLWQVFNHRLERLPESDPGTTVTRDGWVIPFLGLLGYELRYNRRAYEIGGLTFAISHRAGEPEDAPPVHIVGVRQDLGRRPESGRPRLAPHALVQEYLNRSDALWGLVTNGKVLRLLRDSTYIRRQSYVEFDLEAIFEQRLFQDFAALYRLLHRTRLPEAGADAHRCLLEQYYQHSVEQGGRVRDRLRDGVEKCIKILANGFLSHPANDELRASIASSEQRAGSRGGVDEPLTARHSPPTAYRSPLTPEEFYRQLLRLVYRFLFLLVSEDRGLISQHPLYLEHYSVSRFRRLVDNRAAYSQEHDDLWLSLKVLWKLLSDDTPMQQIGGRPLAALLDLTVLDGELFEPLDLDNYEISNHDLLKALWHLINYQETPTSPPRRVNYAALDVEELGSVYESLLDYHPVIMVSSEQRAASCERVSSEQRAVSGEKNEKPLPAGRSPLAKHAAGRSPLAFKFDLVYGSERKSTGSYYTPAELVNELIRSALDPVIEEKLASSERRAVSSDGSTLTEKEKRYVYQVLSRSSRLAKRHGLDRTGLSTDAGFSQGGELRSDLADSASSDINSGEYRRGMGQTDKQGISTIPPGRPGEPARTGDPSPIGASSGSGSRRPGPASSTDVPGHREAVDQPPAQPFNEEAFLKLWQSLPLAARRSLLAEHALLSIRVLDPASGSGHFLLAAARRLGKELARVRTGEEEPSPEAVREAIRDVVSHCIYGVDKNPLAVELCKVALWIEAHAPGKPLTFLDHHIRCGDSLVGVFDLKVLKEGIPDEAFQPVSGDDKKVARSLKKQNKKDHTGQFAIPFDVAAEVQALSAEARAFSDIPDDSPEAIREKKRLYNQLQQKAERDRTACDLWTAAFFQRMASSEHQEASRERRAGSGEGQDEPLAAGRSPLANHAVGRSPLTPPITTDTLRHYLLNGQVHGQTLGMAQALAQKHRFFHWPLEFPEVFEARTASSEHQGSSSERRVGSGEGQDEPLAAYRSPLAEFSGFDVVLGNPPFLGGLKISGTLGDKYRHWLQVAYAPFTGTADLCAAFYRRAFSLLRPGGRMGMVATNTIGQGDTRESSLAVILRQGGAITFAKRFVKWPGAANVEVNLVAIHKRAGGQQRAEQAILDGKPVDFISSRLDDEPEAEPKRLPQNEGKAFIGDYVRGIGFVLEPEEAEALLAKDPRNADCLFPYLNGQDLNSHPEQKPSRWVICFHDWDLERARQYPDLLRIVEERVKPERVRLRGPGDKRNREYWWQFGAYRHEMRRAIAPLRRVLVRSRVSELHALAFVPKGYVYGDATVVFAFDDDYHFALLQSSVHEVWLRKQASSLRTDIRYTPTDCFDTFPFPPEEYRRMASGEWRIEALEGPFAEAARVGAEYHEHRRQIMLARNIGLTKTYNLFHDPNCTDADIQRLRELHAEMDSVILACYGWVDLDPEHGFYQNERGQTRFTVSPEARREILKRLLILNLELAG